MSGYCHLMSEINECADHLPPDRCRCKKTKCGFFTPAGQPEKTIKKAKKAKWFEKYYS